MNTQDVRIGMREKTKPSLGTIAGMVVRQRLLLNRTRNHRGAVLGWVPGHGGKVWVLEDRHGYQAVYSHDEFDNDSEA